MGALQEVRAAAVAGQFYPREAGELRRCVQALLAEAEDRNPPAQAQPIKALIVPHAGYVYSAPIASTAFQRLAGQAEAIRRVILLGPTHHVPVAGLALPGAHAFETPLGRIPVDEAGVQRVQHLPQVKTSPLAHAYEHSLEVQLPFLQLTLGDFQLVPFAVGHPSPEEVAEVLDLLWGGPETLIVVSSDLSHYHPYDVAQRLDRQTCASIASLELLSHHDQACGATPVNGLLLAARRRGLKSHLVDLRNSGNTAGDRRSVVGYGAFVFTEVPVRNSPHAN